MRVSILDAAFHLADTATRSCDSLVVVEFGDNREGEPQLAARLERGLRGALEAYPRAASIVDDRRWRPVQPPTIQRFLTTEQATHSVIERFHDVPLDRKSESTRIALVFPKDRPCPRLLVRMHHAVADGPSLLAFVEQLLRHAYARVAPPRLSGPLELSRPGQPVPNRDSGFSEPTDDLCRPSQISGRRRYVLQDLDERNKRSAAGDGYSFNDLLIAATMHGVRDWAESVLSRDIRVAIAQFINVRADHARGFGNGCAPITLYGPAADGDVRTTAQHLREQLRWHIQNDSWFSKTPPKIEAMNLGQLESVFVEARDRPSTCAPTLYFSHVEGHSNFPWADLVPEVTAVYCVGALLKTRPLSIVATTFRGRTRLVIGYNEEPFGRSIRALLDAITQRIHTS